MDTKTEAQRLISEVICKVAPDVDADELASVDPTTDLFAWFEMDSMDRMSVASEIYERTGINIPEMDYPEMASMESFVRYLTAKRPPEVADDDNV